MSREKRIVGRIFLVLAVATIVVPVGVLLVMEIGFQVRSSRFLSQWGIVGDWFVPALFFTSSGLYLCSAALQFPFKEEENWTCECGYDLSFLQKKSHNCPECGDKILWEWTAQSGHYSRETSRRIGWTMLLFLLSGTMICIGLFLQWANRIANA